MHDQVSIDDVFRLATGNVLPLVVLCAVLWVVFTRVLPEQTRQAQADLKEMAEGFRTTLLAQEAACEKRMDAVLKSHEQQLQQQRADFLATLAQERGDFFREIGRMSQQFEGRLDMQNKSINGLGELLIASTEMAKEHFHERDARMRLEVRRTREPGE